MSQAVVFVVATPIGNLDDMTPRAIATLKNVAIIAAEDTRNTRKLLTHFGILGKELVSYHDHGEEERAASLLDRIESDNLALAIVSDAGTPCVADPGYRLVKMAKERGIKVHPIPGASAVTSLISASGLPSNRFTFVGFLPTKSTSLREALIDHFEFKLEHLLKWEDRNSMFFSLESRVPFLDYRLVEKTLASNPGSFIKNGWTKHILRDAMKGILPERIRRRKDKIGFGTPQAEWFRTEPFIKFITENVPGGILEANGIIDSLAFLKMFDSHLRKEKDFSKEIWKVINLEIWFREIVT